MNYFYIVQLDLIEIDTHLFIFSFSSFIFKLVWHWWCTGESKGYGFVEYQSRDCGQRVRSQLDGRMYEGQALACDWLDTSIVTVAGLHSKLLYVDCLPGGFRDMSQFRTLFSQVANPPYCQVLYTTPATTLFFFLSYCVQLQQLLVAASDRWWICHNISFEN